MKPRAIVLIATLLVLAISSACSSNDSTTSSSNDTATSSPDDSETAPSTTAAATGDTDSGAEFCALLAKQAADVTDQMAKDPASINAQAFLERAKTQNDAALKIVPEEIEDEVTMMYEASRAALEGIANKQSNAETQAALDSKEFKAAAERFKTWRAANCTDEQNAMISGLSSTGT